MMHLYSSYKLESYLHPSKQLLIKTINAREWHEGWLFFITFYQLKYIIIYWGYIITQNYWNKFYSMHTTLQWWHMGPYKRYTRKSSDSFGCQIWFSKRVCTSIKFWLKHGKYLLLLWHRLLVLLLTTYPDCIKEKDPDGNLPIHLLAYHHKGKMWINLSEISGSIFS